MYRYLNKLVVHAKENKSNFYINRQVIAYCFVQLVKNDIRLLYICTLYLQ